MKLPQTPEETSPAPDQGLHPNVPESRLVSLLKARLGRSLVRCEEAGQDVRLEIEAEGLLDAARVLLDDPGLAYDYPADLTAYDTGSAIVLWYRLYSTEHCRTATVAVTLDHMEPVARSLVSIWPGLNWFERECYDLFGVEFDGHPSSGDPTLMRILLPKTWQGFPFRKDYQPVFLGDPLQGPQEPN